MPFAAVHWAAQSTAEQPNAQRLTASQTAEVAHARSVPHAFAA
jgi:hypothetical protein